MNEHEHGKDDAPGILAANGNRDRKFSVSVCVVRSEAERERLCSANVYNSR